MDSACLAIVLINESAPQYAASYHWCKYGAHEDGIPHVCYCGIWWQCDDLVEPTPAMIQWRTGTESSIKEVSGKMLG